MLLPLSVPHKRISDDGGRDSNAGKSSTSSAASHKTEHQHHHEHQHQGLVHRRNTLPLYCLPVVFGASLALLLGSLWYAKRIIAIVPAAPGSKHADFKLIPSSFEELQKEAHIIQEIASSHAFVYPLVFLVTYLFKQTWSTPGSALLNIFAGIAFGYKGFLLVTLGTAAGVACAYTLSRTFGSQILYKLNLEPRIAGLRTKVEQAKASKTLHFFLLALRVMPFCPQWLINLASPHLGIKLPLFVLTTVLGLSPYNFICVQAGATVSTIKLEAGEIVTPKMLGVLVLIAAVMIVPALFRERIEKWLLNRRDQSSAGGGDAADGTHTGTAVGGKTKKKTAATATQQQQQQQSTPKKAAYAEKAKGSEHTNSPTHGAAIKGFGGRSRNGTGGVEDGVAAADAAIAAGGGATSRHSSFTI